MFRTVGPSRAEAISCTCSRRPEGEVDGQTSRLRPQREVGEPFGLVARLAVGVFGGQRRQVTGLDLHGRGDEVPAAQVAVLLREPELPAPSRSAGSYGDSPWSRCAGRVLGIRLVRRDSRCGERLHDRGAELEIVAAGQDGVLATGPLGEGAQGVVALTADDEDIDANGSIRRTAVRDLGQ